MFIVAIFWALVRVVLFICIGFGLLRVTKTRLRHVPTRRTRISRHHGESTLWLERLVNALIDMFHHQSRTQQQQQQQQQQPGTQQAPPKGVAGGTGSAVPGSRDSPHRSSSPLSGLIHPTKDAISFAIPGLGAPSSYFFDTDNGNASPQQQQQQQQQQVKAAATGEKNAKSSADEDDAFFDSPDDEPDNADRPQFLVQLEERVNALLEDSGIAAWSDFRIRSLGEQPPRVKAIHIIHAGMTQAPPPPGSAAANASGMSSSAAGAGSAAAAMGGERSGHAQYPTTPEWGSPHIAPSNPGNAAAAGGGGGGVGDTVNSRGGVVGGAGHNPISSSMLPSDDAGEASGGTAHRRSPQLPHAQGPPLPPLMPLPSHGSPPNMGVGSPGGGGVRTEGIAAGGGSSLPRSHSDGANLVGSVPSAANTSSSVSSSSQANATTIEFEAELEYAGGLDVSLRADLCLLRGRQLPLQVRFHKVRHVRAHIRVLATLHYDAATIESPPKPYLMATVWFESDPAFDLTMRTSITRLNIRDLFLLPILVKFFLLRSLRARLKRASGGPGITVKIPLPADIIDGGELWRNAHDVDDGRETDDGRSTRAPTTRGWA